MSKRTNQPQKAAVGAVSAEMSEILAILPMLETQDLLDLGAAAFAQAKRRALDNGDLKAVLDDARQRLFKDGVLSEPIVYEDHGIVAVGNLVSYQNPKTRRHQCSNTVVSVEGSDPAYIWDSSSPAYLSSESVRVGEDLFSAALFLFVENMRITERDMRYDGTFHKIEKSYSWKVESGSLIQDNDLDVSKLPPPSDGENDGSSSPRQQPEQSVPGVRRKRRMSPADAKKINRR